MRRPGRQEGYPARARLGRDFAPRGPLEISSGILFLRAIFIKETATLKSNRHGAARASGDPSACWTGR